MTNDELKAQVLETLCTIAPEAGEDPPMADEDLRETLDLDSMDFLNFIRALHERFDVDIPESDYGKLSTLDAIATYLRSREPSPYEHNA